MLVLVVIPAAAACGDGPIEPPPALEIVTIGRLERGVEVRLELHSNGVPIPEGEVGWTVHPSDAAIVTGPSTVLPTKVGELTFAATAGTRSISTTAVVALPPTIVFDRLVSGNRDIWAAYLDGEDATRLTTHSGDDSDPSAGGGSVVFVSYRNGNADLYMVPVAGGLERRLTTSTRNEAAPSLADDGRSVVYTSDAAGVTRLWTLDAESGVAARLTLEGESAADIHASPAWRSRSDSVVFVSTALGSADIHLARTSSGVVEPITQAPSAEVEPAISRDGTKAVFVSNRDGNDELYLMTLPSGEVQRLTQRPGSDAHPAWLPDGRIVFTGLEGSVTSLYWLDPEDPDVIHQIPGTQGAGHPAGATQ